MYSRAFWLLTLILLSVSCATKKEAPGTPPGKLIRIKPAATKGSFIVAPFDTVVHLVNTDGETKRTWVLDQKAFHAVLLRDGALGAMTTLQLENKSVLPYGRFEIRGANNRLLWEYINPDIHHDFEELENGDFLFTTISQKVLEWKGIKAKCDRLIRVNRMKEIVWDMELSPIIPWKEITNEWDEELSTRGGYRGFCYVNSIREKEGKILISLRALSRIAVIDMNEKKLLWMSPKGAFKRQHDARWMADGRIMVFNNREPKEIYNAEKVIPSSVLAIDPKTNAVQNMAYGTGYPFQWSSPYMGGSQPLSNGNIWISISMDGQMIEVTPTNEIVQRYMVFPRVAGNYSTTVFKSVFYEENPVLPVTKLSSAQECPDGVVAWDKCQAQARSGEEGSQQNVQMKLRPGACEGSQGEAIFRCQNGRWELLKSVRCEWSCPCCY